MRSTHPYKCGAKRNWLALIAIAAIPLLALAQDGPGNGGSAKSKASEENSTTREAGLVTARHNALNASHQIAASQGFRQRDTIWSASLPNEGFTIVPLQLYSGNTYYIVLGSDTTVTGTISAAAFDPHRKLIKVAPDQTAGKLVLKIVPEKSGPHYIRIHQKQGLKKVTHCALTYIYR